MRIAAALWRSSHPGPTVVVTVLALALGVSVGVDAARLAVLVVSVLLGQLSIGISNDAIDAPRDRLTGRTDKPIARGDVPSRAAWIAAWSTLVGGPRAVGAARAGSSRSRTRCSSARGGRTTRGSSRRVFSALCFVVGFGVFPSLAPLALPEPVVAAPWAWVAGATLGARRALLERAARSR